MNFKNKGDKRLGCLNGFKNNYSTRGAVSAHLKEVKKTGNRTRRTLDKIIIKREMKDAYQ